MQRLGSAVAVARKGQGQQGGSPGPEATLSLSSLVGWSYHSQGFPTLEMFQQVWGPVTGVLATPPACQ